MQQGPHLRTSSVRPCHGVVTLCVHTLRNGSIWYAAKEEKYQAELDECHRQLPVWGT